jgi:hypothetical protein
MPGLIAPVWYTASIVPGRELIAPVWTTSAVRRKLRLAPVCKRTVWHMSSTIPICESIASFWQAS